MHEELIAALERSGIAFISSTRLRGRFSLRMCIMNFTTRDEDVEATIAFLANEPVARHPSPPAAVFEPHVALERGWLGRPRINADELTLLPLFSELDEAQARRVLAAATERTFAEGEAIVVEGDGSRELYIVLDGEAAISRGGMAVAVLGIGEPIGEIAALEWGAGFGYARTATATATTALRALVIPAGDVGELVRAIPVLGDRLRVIARSRLHGS